MNDPNALLSTLSQSSAVMVAIIGGFLVSKLVTLSSEREGIRRQLTAARERLAHLHADYGPIHDDRLATSESYFYDVALDKLIEDSDAELAAIIEENVPRGSSVDEITPYAMELKARVEAAFGAIAKTMKGDDTREVDLDDLRGRGISIPEDDEDIFENVMYHVRSKLPIGSGSSIAQWPMPPVTPGWSHEIEARRFDESIRAELELVGQMTATEGEVSRLESELAKLGQPVGVVPAIWILSLLSLLGIVVPVVVMAMDPVDLSVWARSALIGLFVAGLGAVLGYIVWYLKHLDSGES
jgi:hypothetical protein